MTAVIRLRLNQAAPERLAPPSALHRTDAGRWPIYVSIIAALLVSAALWAAIGWTVSLVL